MSVRNRGRAVNVPGRVQARVFEEGSRWLPKTETSQQGIDYARLGIHNDRRPESDFFLGCQALTIRLSSKLEHVDATCERPGQPLCAHHT